MRFELKADDVKAIVHLIYICLDLLPTMKLPEQITAKACLSRLLRKIKLYGLDSYPNREMFRVEMKRLDELINT